MNSNACNCQICHLSALLQIVSAARASAKWQRQAFSMSGSTSFDPLLNLIGKSEGTDRRRGYNETLGYGAYTGGDRDLCSMTLDQIDALQGAMLRHPNNRWNSSALGRYQIVRTTLRSLRRRLGLDGRDLFDAAMQDRLAAQLLIGRGFTQFISGRKSEDDFINALAREWASLPTTAGVGYYGGQRAHVTLAEVRRALAQCLGAR